MIVTSDRSKSVYALEVTPEGFATGKDSLVGVVAYKVKFDVRISYRLIDARSDAAPLSGTASHGTASADYNREVRDGAFIFGVLAGTSALIKDGRDSCYNSPPTQPRRRPRKTWTIRAPPNGPASTLCNAPAPRSSTTCAPLPNTGWTWPPLIVKREITLQAGRRSPGGIFDLYNGTIPVYAMADDPLRRSLVLARVKSTTDHEAVYELAKVQRNVSRQMRERRSESPMTKTLIGT